MATGPFVEGQIQRIVDSGLSRGPARTFVLGATMVATQGPVAGYQAAVARAVGEFIALKPRRPGVSN